MAFNKGKGSKPSGGRSFSRDKPRYGDRTDRGSSRSFGGGGRSGGALQLFDVTCAQCGTETQVPFKPSGERPVLCRSCFTGGDGGSRAARPAARAGGDSSRELREINEKLDKIMHALDIE